VAGHSGELDGDNRGTPAVSAGRLSWRTEEGSAAAEAGLIISVLLLLVVGTVEFGRAFWTYNTMLLAVEDAGRFAMVRNHGGPLETCRLQTQALNCPALSNTPLANCSASRALQVLSAYQAPNISVSATEETTPFATTITICASYSFDFIAPQLLPYGPVDLTSRITVPLI
jgi:Flp pilus assembly protein TadG